MDDVEKLFPLLWALYGQFTLNEGKVIFNGTSQDVEEFHEALVCLDPTFSRGIE